MKHLTTLLGILMSSSLLAQSEYCGTGTTWDAESQTCIVAENVELLDSNLDGVVGVEDLLNLLSHFGDEDMDFDGIYDSVDDCVGAYDECGVCNGPGPQILGIDTIIVYYDSLYAEAIDEWWVFEVDADTLLGYFCENPGCMDPTADNYDPYAIEEDNSCMWAEGSPVCDFQNSFTFDEYTYDLVAIGDQCWFAENLRTEHYANGDTIPTNLSDSEWASTTSGAMAVYGEESGCQNWSPDGNACDPAWSLNEYGRLYNWFAVNDERGLCPTGWHVPSDGEWMTLEMELGMSESDANGIQTRGDDQGTQMKTTYGWADGGNGTNLSGFSGLPGGSRYGSLFYYAGNVGFWWSASSNEPMAWYRMLYKGHTTVYRGYQDQRCGFSVRCIKNAN